MVFYRGSLYKFVGFCEVFKEFVKDFGLEK